MKDKLIEKQREYISVLSNAMEHELGDGEYNYDAFAEESNHLMREISALEKQIADKPKFTTCPDCGGDMFSTVLTHYKCRKCKKQFTN